MASLFPQSSDYPARRLFSLDLLRGLDIFALTILTWLMLNAKLVWKLPNWVCLQFSHTWGVFSFVDCTQPLFIFICGAAAPFALSRRLTSDGGQTPSFWRHVFGRVVMLWTVGMLLHGQILTFDPSKFTIYNGTLQSIAVAYFAAAVSLLMPSVKRRIALAVLLVLLPGILQIWYGDYTETGNLSRIIDGAIISWSQAHFGYAPLEDKPFCYTLTTLTWGGLGIIGTLSAGILREKSLNEWQKARRLSVWGGGLLVIGLVSALWVPANRFIYTLPFVAITMGMSILLLVSLFVLCDIYRFRAHLGLFLLFGQFALTAWCMHTLFRPVLRNMSGILVQGIPQLMGTDRYMPLITEIGFDVLFTAVLVIRQRLKARV